MDIHSDFSCLPSKIYANKMASKLGKTEEILFRYSEGTKSLVLDHYNALKRAGRPPYFDFFLNLNRTPFSASKIETCYPDMFYISRKAEKKGQNLLFDNKVIPSVKRPTIIRSMLGYTKEALVFGAVLPIAGISGITSGPAVLTSFGLKAAIKRMRHDIIGLSPKGRERFLKRKEELSVITLNLSLSESDSENFKKHLAGPFFRGIGFARFFLKAKGDILCMQQAYDSLAVSQLVIPHLIKKNYFVALTVKPEKIRGSTAGLMIASRFPIRDICFHEFKTKNNKDRSKKGVLMAAVEVKKGEYICVANTELNRQFDGDEPDCQRRLQIIEAKRAVHAFIEQSEHEIKDIIFCGDFQLSRFEQQKGGKLNKAREGGHYAALVQNLFRKDRITKTRYKDLTKSDSNLSYKQFIKRILRTDLEWEDECSRVSFNESGSRKGSLLDSEAFTFTYFIELVQQRILNKLSGDKYQSLRKKISSKDIHCYINQYLLGKKDFEFLNENKFIDLTRKDIQNMQKMTKKYLRKTKKSVFIKPDCPDHICLAKRKNNIFSEKGYKYALKTPIGNGGVLSNHRALKVVLKQKS